MRRLVVLVVVAVTALAGASPAQSQDCGQPVEIAAGMPREAIAKILVGRMFDDVVLTDRQKTAAASIVTRWISARSGLDADDADLARKAGALTVKRNADLTALLTKRRDKAKVAACIEKFDAAVLESGATPRTAVDCMATLRSDISSLRITTAHRCADSVVARGVRAADVPALASLYDAAGDPVRARAHLLLRELGVPIFSTQFDLQFAPAPKRGPPSPARGDGLIARLDSLPPSVNDLKVRAYEKFLADAVSSGENGATIYFARELIELGKRVRPRPIRLDSVMGSATYTLAQAFGDAGRADSALAAIARVRLDVSAATYERAGLRLARTRYALVDQPAPPIAAPHWFNVSGRAGPATFGHGKVTVVQFTGVDCAPCSASSPALLTMYSRYPRTALDMVFVAALSGQLDGKKVSRAAELRATRDIYTKQYGIPFRLGVEDKAFAEAASAKLYGVTGVPETVVIDKKGIVRRIMSGWDAASASSLISLVSELVAEP